MMTTSGARNCIAHWISGTENLSNLYHVFLVNGEESYSHNVLLAKLFHCFEGQDLICYRSLKTFCAIFLVTVPPIPSQGDLPWLVTKNNQIASNPKSFRWLHKFIRFLKFLYWPAQALLQVVREKANWFVNCFCRNPFHISWCSCWWHCKKHQQLILCFGGQYTHIQNEYQMRRL